MTSEKQQPLCPKCCVKIRDFAYLDKMEGLLERRLPHMYGRAGRMRAICGILGEALELDSELLAQLDIGARYHDLGLLGVPDTLLGANRKLTNEERKIVENHVTLGGELLNLGFSDCPQLLEIVWFHHERMDGNGPLGVPGNLIPVAARIAFLASAIESMTSWRPHRGPLPREEVVDDLLRASGKQFDGGLVQTFLNVRDKIFSSLGKSRGGEVAKSR